MRGGVPGTQNSESYWNSFGYDDDTGFPLMMPSKTVLYFILNWGLGHATRSIPVIRALLERDHRVVIVSTGRSLALMRSEFDGCEFEDLPDYGIRYNRLRGFLIFDLLMRMPGFFLRLLREHRESERLAARFKADLIVSDNRYGCYSKHLPSYLITHQLRFQLPGWLRWSAWISEWFNRSFFRHYRNILIPDESGTPNLSGDLSHRGRITGHPKLRFIGPLSSLNPGSASGNEDIDMLFMISGPEPQRTEFEELILGQAGVMPGVKAVVLGKPEQGTGRPSVDRQGFSVYPHLDRDRLAAFLGRARWVVSRSGYTTIMELMAAKRKAILVPTPGQTEQEYLAGYLRQEGLFFSVAQDHLDLRRVFHDAERFYKQPRPAMCFNRLDEILHLIGGGSNPSPKNGKGPVIFRKHPRFRRKTGDKNVG
jgi:hypothetical protein